MIYGLILAVIIGVFIFLKRKPKKVKLNYVLMINKDLTADEKSFGVILNTYRASLGKSVLKCDLEVSRVIAEHVDWMIVGGVSHIGDKSYADRREYLVSKGAKAVGEILGKKYRTPQTTFNAFLNSATHKKVIEGNYDAFGISIKQEVRGVKYYGVLFIDI